MPGQQDLQSKPNELFLGVTLAGDIQLPACFSSLVLQLFWDGFHFKVRPKIICYFSLRELGLDSPPPEDGLVLVTYFS